MTLVPYEKTKQVWSLYHLLLFSRLYPNCKITINTRDDRQLSYPRRKYQPSRSLRGRDNPKTNTIRKEIFAKQKNLHNRQMDVLPPTQMLWIQTQHQPYTANPERDCFIFLHRSSNTSSSMGSGGPKASEAVTAQSRETLSMQSSVSEQGESCGLMKTSNQI